VPPRHTCLAAYCSRLGRDTVARRVQKFLTAGLAERRAMVHTARRAEA
jgi:hypothetical protein